MSCTEDDLKLIISPFDDSDVPPPVQCRSSSGDILIFISTTASIFRVEVPPFLEAKAVHPKRWNSVLNYSGSHPMTIIITNTNPCINAFRLYPKLFRQRSCHPYTAFLEHKMLTFSTGHRVGYCCGRNVTGTVQSQKRTTAVRHYIDATQKPVAKTHSSATSP
jgi:hypothetical protein